MSINPAIWRKASRWSKRVALAVLVAAGAASVPWARLAAGYQERRAQRTALAPLIADAEREHLTFPQVVVAHPAHANKTVYWLVTVQSSTSSYAHGRPSWPILWTNPERVQAEHMYQPERVLARVAAVKDEAIYLEYIGRP